MCLQNFKLLPTMTCALDKKQMDNDYIRKYFYGAKTVKKRKFKNLKKQFLDIVETGVCVCKISTF